MTAEHPIIMSSPMVRAILEGRKTQTRRIVKPQPGSDINPVWIRDAKCWQWATLESRRQCPYGAPGDRLWVRETWALGRATFQDHTDVHPIGVKQRNGATSPVIYRANGLANDKDFKWKPSIFMPRKLSRITLEVTGVCVERLQDISEDDAVAEGCVAMPGMTQGGGVSIGTAVYWFQKLWDSINGKTHPWSSNPFVWVIAFRPLAQGLQ